MYSRRVLQFASGLPVFSASCSLLPLHTKIFSSTTHYLHLILKVVYTHEDKKKSIIFQVIINTIRLERKLGFFSYKLISIYKLLVLFLWKLHPIPFFLTTFQKELYIIKALLGCVKLQIVSMKISKTNPDHFITLHDMANLGTMFSWSFL